MTDHKIRCVVTGLGMVSAIGNTVDECWENAKAGKSGIKPATSVVTEGCYANLGAEVSATDLDTLPGAEEMDRVSRLCVKAAGEAVRDAGLDMQKEDAGRVGVIMGSCVGGVVSIENYYRNGERAEDVTKMPISAIANMVARAYGAGGVVTNVANACAAGTISIAYACDLIRAGVGDVFIAGGADAFASVPYAGFLSLHALDALPCSPFNRCSGITLGEGSGALVIESYDHAVARGAHIICEVLGAGVSSDAHHITAPRPDGEGQMNAILRALKNSGLTPKDISYINAHGTGTAKNDEAEFLSLHTIFDAENDDLSVSSTKAMVGHCLGAAGAIEAVFTVKALTDGVVPPTVGYTDEDLVRLSERAGKIDVRPNVAREKQMTNVMSNSFAFGGNNASIVFSREAGNVTLPEKKQDVYITGLGLVLPGGNGIPAYLGRAAKGEAPDSPSVMSAVGHDDFDACGLKMAFYRKLDKFSQLQAVSGMEALADAHAYCMVCCAGMVFIFGYNGICAILRGMGESRLPMYFVGVAAVINVVLDLLFVAVFSMGASGAALATVIAQGCSFALALVCLYRRRESFHFDFRPASFRPQADRCRGLFKLGIPMIIQSVMIAISVMFVNAHVNTFGVAASAVDGVGNKLNTISFTLTNALGVAAAAMIGQCFGARKHDRLKKVFWYTTAISMSIFVVLACVSLLFPEQLFRLFTSDESVIAYASGFMRIAVLYYLANCTMLTPYSLLEGTGSAGLSLIIGILDGVVARIGLCWLLGAKFGLYGFWLGSALAGFVTTIGGSIYYFSGKWKTKKLVLHGAEQ